MTASLIGVAVLSFLLLIVIVGLGSASRRRAAEQRRDAEQETAQREARFPPSWTHRVGAAGAEVRVRPDAECEPLRRIEPGIQVAAGCVSGLFRRVKTMTGTVGWVEAGCLEPLDGDTDESGREGGGR